MNATLFRQKKIFPRHVTEKLSNLRLDYKEKNAQIDQSRREGSKHLKAAVVLLLNFKKTNGHAEYVFQLIKRSRKVAQGGDISCPGGMLQPRQDFLLSALLAKGLLPLIGGKLIGKTWREDGDTPALIRLFLTTALREAWEEIGLNPYGKPDFEGYTIRRYRFTPETEEITEFLIDWFEPKGEKPVSGYPLVMNSPITGGGMQLENIFSRHFADHGMAVCLVHRPERYDREPKRLDQSGYWWRMMTRQSRIAYHWALQRGEIDPARTASFGISNGGFRNTFFAAAEPNVKAHIICLAGGDLVGMLCDSDFFAEPREEIMKTRGWDETQLRAWLETVVNLETTDYAPYTDPDSVLMICARLDRIVPYRNGLRLWEAFGRPEFIALPFGHYSSAYFIPYIKRVSLEFIQKRFESVR